MKQKTGSAMIIVRVRRRARRTLSLCVILIGMLAILSAASAQDKKLKPEELVAKHLEAIGSAEARISVKSRVASGMAKAVNRLGGSGAIEGEAMMVSAGLKLRYGMNFPSTDYPGEQMAFDGKRAATGFLPNGQRSQMSLFLNQQDLPLKEGLLGGVLSTAWPLLRLSESQPKLEYRGLKKVAGRQLHELGYRPRKGSSDLTVVLYFDPETFRHASTQYRFQVGARLGTVANEVPRQDESYYTLTEEFDDFRAVDGLTLPHKYKLQISAQTSRATLLSDWLLELRRISHRESFDEQIFIIK
jgi:hypothetical protein